MENKQSARSPHYGKIVAYDTQGRVIQEIDMLRIKVEHDNVDFTIGGILTYAVKHEGEVAVLKDKVAALQEQNKLQDERIVALEENIKALVLAVQNLSSVIQGTEIMAGE
jgi:hypothetical protein